MKRKAKRGSTAASTRPFCNTLYFRRTGSGDQRERRYCVRMENSPDYPAVTVWYDSQCPLCVREIALMRKMDTRGAIEFVDVFEGHCPLDRQTLLERFHAQEIGQPVVSGAAAFAAMWRAIPRLAPLGRLARHRPVLWLLERLYRVFLVLRPAMQRVARRWLGETSAAN